MGSIGLGPDTHTHKQAGSQQSLGRASLSRRTFPKHKLFPVVVDWGETIALFALPRESFARATETGHETEEKTCSNKIVMQDRAGRGTRGVFPPSLVAAACSRLSRDGGMAVGALAPLLQRKRVVSYAHVGEQRGDERVPGQEARRGEARAAGR